jgi:hypothetical protein
MIKKFLTSAAATAMVAAPVAASAAPAAPTSAASSLSIGKSVRAATPTSGANKAAAGTGRVAGIALGVLLAGGIIYAIVDGSKDDDNSDSN